MKLVNIHILALMLLFSLLQPLKAEAQEAWSLQQCIDTALVHNRSLQIEENNLALANEKHRELKANLIPKVNAQADYRYFFELPYQLMPMSLFGGPQGQFKEVQFGVPHNIGANVNVGIPVYDPQLYGGIRATKEAKEISRLQYRKTAEQVYFDVSNLYYNAQILQHQLAFVDSNISNAQALLKNLQLVHSLQMATGTEVSKVELQLAQLTTDRQTLASKQQNVINLLKLSIGRPLGSSLSVLPAQTGTTTLEYTPKPTVEMELVKAKSRVLNTELSTLKRSRIPSVSVFGSYGVTGFGYDESPNEFLDFYPIGLAGLKLNVPIFNGTVTTRKINQKKLELKNNELLSESLTDRTTIQLVNAQEQKLTAEQTMQNYMAQTALAQQVYEQTLLQHRQETASLTEVLLADNELRKTQQNYLNALIDYFKADLELKKISGNISINEK
ncbi:MAG: TolC family protein [Flavobacteriales bacterium]|nr:TolC family protein [Flavobacteriales bacterium]